MGSKRAHLADVGKFQRLAHCEDGDVDINLVNHGDRAGHIELLGLAPVVQHRPSHAQKLGVLQAT